MAEQVDTVVRAEQVDTAVQAEQADTEVRVEPVDMAEVTMAVPEEGTTVVPAAALEATMAEPVVMAEVRVDTEPVNLAGVPEDTVVVLADTEALLGNTAEALADTAVEQVVPEAEVAPGSTSAP